MYNDEEYCIDPSSQFSISVDEVNKEIGNDLSPEHLWQDPEELMYENIHDVDSLEKEEHSLFREGITGDLFKSNIIKAILKHLPKAIVDLYGKENSFKIRYFRCSNIINLLKYLFAIRVKYYYQI